LRVKASRAAGAEAAWIYKKLFQRFGPQGWWPVTRDLNRGPVYHKKNTYGPLTQAQMFEVAVGAILTQNTNWSNVEKALANLARRGVGSFRAVLKTPLPVLQKDLRPSGYFRQKARRLKIFARHMDKNWRGRWDRFFSRPLEKIRAELLSINGIGPETADSILLYAGGAPVFVVDAYTRRLGERFGLFGPSMYSEVQNFFMKNLKASKPLFREYHALIVAQSKAFCRAAPRCGGCPLNSRCSFPGKNSLS
jgi:endonuclease-3 related protein